MHAPRQDMSPREFLKFYRYDPRVVTGEYFSSKPLCIERGDRVGVVLMNLGGPDTVADVEPFLYNLFMDPAIIDIPVGGAVRHWLSRYVASRRARTVASDYEQIGGGAPINRLTREQAQSLEKYLNRNFGESARVEFKTYIAMRHWHPFSEEAAAQMQSDGINKVVLLPLYPQYSKTTTGSSLVYWYVLQQRNEIPTWATTYVFQYAANPKYVQAVNDRIDEALQRFSKEDRDDVHLVFSAYGTPIRELRERRDPYCCLVNSSVDRVMNMRQFDRPYHVSFQNRSGPAEWLTPNTPDKLEELAHDGVKSVLIVPISFVTDHVETTFELDIAVREEAASFGIENYEVTSGLNCHPLFIASLAEATIAQLVLPGRENSNRALDYDLKPIKSLPHHPGEERCTRCSQCPNVIEARRWEDQPIEECRGAVPEEID